MKRVPLRRSGFVIKIELLAKAMRAIKPTRLMYACNLQYVSFVMYVDQLIEAGCLSKLDPPRTKRGKLRNKNVRYLLKTTEKGRELLQAFFNSKLTDIADIPREFNMIPP